MKPTTKQENNRTVKRTVIFQLNIRALPPG